PDEAWPHFQGWRVNYESIVYRLAWSIDAVPALWSGPRRSGDRTISTKRVVNRTPDHPEGVAVSFPQRGPGRPVNPTGLRRTFAARRAQLAGELKRLTERPADPVGNLSFGKRIGDGTNEAVDRINTTAAARSIAASIAELDRAVEKLDEGTYGRCDRCGRPIAAERL